MLAFILAATLAANTGKVIARYEKQEAPKLVPMLSEVIRFPTYQYQDQAFVDQKAWLMKTAKELGFTARDAGKITEIELPGPANAPVLGLVIHGDVQIADVEAWTFPAFGGEVRDGYVLGRGAADDKGPLIQALLAMKSLKESGLARTHTIRLLVGSEEESSATEMSEYVKDHQPPDYSLVLDSEFPVVVGEKAWDGLGVMTTLTERSGVTKPYEVAFIEAGLSPSIVPDRAEVKLQWRKSAGPMNWEPVENEINAAKSKLPPDTRLVTGMEDNLLRVVAYGKSAHSGVNLTGGRNALIALARVLEGKLPSGGADDLLAFARMAGQDLHGTGLGITDSDPIWGRYGVNVATIKPTPDDPAQRPMLYINLRRIPPRTGADIRQHLLSVVEEFNKKTGASLIVNEEQSYFKDEPLGFDPNAKIVKRLMTVYERATGEKAKPAISGGGTYAKRLPNAIAFGMWFPGKAYPGHDLDEKIPIADLQRGTRVLIHALVDLATQKPIADPFKP